jgi:DNA-binding transcriptional LysR family regulator
MAITLTQLRSFLAVVHEGSTAAAADRLFVTQPSISAAVSALSEELGVKLTERVGRGVRPSPAGVAFTPFAADVIGLLDQGRRAAMEAAGQASRELRIAAVTTAAEYLVPTLMQAFGLLYPEIVLALDVGNRDRVLRQLLEHEADIAIGGRPPGGDHVTGQTFMRNEICLIARPDHPLTDGRVADLDELGASTWLLREEGSGTRAMTEHYLEAHGLRPASGSPSSPGWRSSSSSRPACCGRSTPQHPSPTGTGTCSARRSAPAGLRSRTSWRSSPAATSTRSSAATASPGEAPPRSRARHAPTARRRGGGAGDPVRRSAHAGAGAGASLVSEPGVLEIRLGDPVGAHQRDRQAEGGDLARQIDLQPA